MNARIRLVTVSSVLVCGLLACREDADEYEPPVSVIRDTASPAPSDAADTAPGLEAAAEVAVDGVADVAAEVAVDAGADVTTSEVTADMGGAGALTAGVACRGFAISYCARRVRCLPAEFASRYRDAAACEAAVTSACEGFLAHADIGDTPFARRACGEGLATADCRTVLSTDPARGCGFVAGKRADGAGCSVQDQCASQFCRRTGPGCGTCVARLALGANCMANPAGCPIGTTCLLSAAVSVCTALGALGEQCLSTKPCHPSLVCVGATCVARAAAGAECRTRLCDDSAELVCSAQGSTCVAMPAPAAVGAACGPDATPTGADVRCVAGAGCYERNNSEICVADAAAGAACDLDEGPGCAPGHTCANSVCIAVPPVAICPP